MTRHLIVDSTNNFIRNYTIVPTLNANGQPTGGYNGFLKSLGYFIRMCKPTSVICVWDGAGGSQRRREVVKEYKEGRKPVKLNRNFEFELVNIEENKIWQIQRLSQYLADLPVYQVIIDNIEADDTIAYLVNHYPDDEKVIVSTDRDFYQLVDKKTIIFTPTKKKFITIDAILQEYSIHPNNFAVARSVIGDKSDNLKGLSGIGNKTIVKLFPQLTAEQVFTIDQLFEFSEQNKDVDEKYKRITESRELIIKNLQLMDLKNSIISPQAVHKIKQKLETKLQCNATEFRKKLLEDGIQTISDTFLEYFKFLK